VGNERGKRGMPITKTKKAEKNGSSNGPLDPDGQLVAKKKWKKTFQRGRERALTTLGRKKNGETAE